MADYLTRDLKIAVSASPESSYNTMRIAGTDAYLGMLTTSRGFYIPDKEKLDDTGKVGTGREFPTEQRSGYISVPSLEISEELNIDVGAILLRRAMGGADAGGSLITTDGYSTTAEDTLGFYSHTFGLAANNTVAGRQLPSSSLLWSLGGADYIWGGVVVDQFRIEQTNSNVPTFTATMVGSGLNKRLRYLTANGELAVNGSNAYNGPYAGATNTEYPPSFPAPLPQRYMLGAETICQFNNGSNYVITDFQRLKTFSLTLNNNHRTDDRRPGDPRLESDQPRAGHYINRLLHGDRSVAAEITVMLDDDMAEFADAYNDTIITSFKYTAQGNLLVSSEVQTETITATSGTRTLTVGGQTTSALQYDATASQIQTALNALSTVNPGDITVSGPGPYVYTFGGQYLGQNVATITVDGTNLTGGTSTFSVTRVGGTESAEDNQGIFEITLPKCYFRGIRGSDDNGDAIITISLFPVDDLTNGPMTARIVNNTIAAIV